MAKPRGTSARTRTAKAAERYTHPGQTSPMRPDVGTQAQFKKKKPPKTYRYDSSLSPALAWDGQNGARELGEWLLGLIEKAAALPASHAFDAAQEFKASDGQVLATVHSLDDAVARLKRLGGPFLDWAGKAERLSFDVPTLPLFVHERLSTKAIVDTLVGHRKGRQTDLWDLFGDPQHSITDQVLKAYEYPDKWVNRMILGDSLVVMNSLLQYEGLGGQVQMIYIDPPYGVKFGSNFQPFVRRRDVSHNADDDLTREPEMVKAYRDTWELGLHSYLTYMRDRLLLARDLLAPSGSVFVQISDENLHHVRELMDEVFGAENLVAVVPFKKTSGASSPTAATNVIASVCDYLLWYGRDISRTKYKQLYFPKTLTPGDLGAYTQLELKDGTRRPMSTVERQDLSALPAGARVFRTDNLTGQSGVEKTRYAVEFDGHTYRPAKGVWKTSEKGMRRLIEQSRVALTGETLKYVRYYDDFPVIALNNFWEDTVIAGFGDQKIYAVQTSAKVVARCILMTTDPGDLVLDPTCGSGTTAYVAEQWGRRWITIDTSRVPLALARQRLLTATFPYYQLKEAPSGPGGGFIYKRKQNRKGEEVGGIVPHITLKSIANDEPPDEEVLVDRPEVDNAIVRVTGPFAFEATIPTPVDWDEDGVEAAHEAPGAAGHKAPPYASDAYGAFVERMIEVLRRSPVLHVGGGKTVQLTGVRPPAKSLSLSAEGLVRLKPDTTESVRLKPDTTELVRLKADATSAEDDQAVAFVFGPESGAVSEKLVHAALREAHLKSYSHLYVVGFAIQPHARELVENAAAVGFIPATYVQATPDLMMGDLLKNMRSSQIFSVCGLPDVKVHTLKPERNDDPARYQIELLGLDTFDPTTMDADHRPGSDVPAWFLDGNYNDLCFHVTQAFFPRTGAWNDLRKSLKGDYDDAVWDHLAGTKSAPFEAGDNGQVAVKVIDDRGNELMVVRKLATD